MTAPTTGPSAVAVTSSSTAMPNTTMPTHLLRVWLMQPTEGAAQEADGLTTGSGIGEAMIRAAQRGADVRRISDKTMPRPPASGIVRLAVVGVTIWIDHEARIARAKTIVIDETVTLTGSYNWTRGAAANYQPRPVPCCRGGLRGSGITRADRKGVSQDRALNGRAPCNRHIEQTRNRCLAIRAS
jgi:PLD-like domain